MPMTRLTLIFFATFSSCCYTPRCLILLIVQFADNLVLVCQPDELPLQVYSALPLLLHVLLPCICTQTPLLRAFSACLDFLSYCMRLCPAIVERYYCYGVSNVTQLTLQVKSALAVCPFGMHLPSALKHDNPKAAAYAGRAHSELPPSF